MAETYSVLGQVAPAANTNTTLYTAANPTVVSTIVVCNRGLSTSNYSIAVRPAGAAIENKHYNFYNIPLPKQKSEAITIGMTLSATDVVTVSSDSVDLSFTIYGSVITP